MRIEELKRVDYFSRLGIKDTASKEKVLQRYEVLKKKYKNRDKTKSRAFFSKTLWPAETDLNPDKNSSDALEKLALIQHAYDLLSTNLEDYRVIVQYLKKNNLFNEVNLSKLSFFTRVQISQCHNHFFRCQNQELNQNTFDHFIIEHSNIYEIKYADLKMANPEFVNLVLPFYRTEAAKVIQQAAKRRIRKKDYKNPICSLVKMSVVPVALSTTELKKTFDRKRAYILFDSKLYYIEKDAKIRLVATNADQKLKDAFLCDNDIFQTLSLVELVKIVTLMGTNERKLMVRVIKHSIEDRFFLHGSLSAKIKPTKKLFEMQEDGFQEKTVDLIKANQYHLIDYAHNNFTRRLFSILKKGLITSNEMMTVKLMYESLFSFNKGKMPDNPSEQFTRFKLNDPAGPYQPSKQISYWCTKNSHEFHQKMTEFPQNYYYVINFSHHQMVAFIYYKLESIIEDVNHIDTFFLSLLKKYIGSFFVKNNIGAPREKDVLKFKRILINLETFVNDAFTFKDIYTSIKQLQLFILLQEPHLENFIMNIYDPADSVKNLGLSQTEFLKEHDDIQFIVNLDSVSCQIPSFCISPQYNEDFSDSPILSFVLPTIDALNLLQKIVHGEDLTLPTPVVGQLSAKMIRSYDEIPIVMAGQSLQPFTLTAEQQNLKKLYPMTSVLEIASRPIELTHPDANKTAYPHEADCRDFMLSWHDLFHAWRSGSNYKGFIRRLRLLHDDKAGFAVSKQLMPTTVWNLTDIDLSVGKEYRENKCCKSIDSRILNIAGFFHTLKIANYNFEQMQDDNYLFLFSFFNSKDEWIKFHDFIHPQRFLDDHENDELFMLLKMEKEQNLIGEINVISRDYQKVRSYLENNSNASIVEIILHDLLEKKPQAVDPLLLKTLSIEDYQSIFYWSQNSGIFFREKFKCYVDNLKPKLRENTPDLIRQTLYKIAKEKYSDFDFEQSVESLQLSDVKKRASNRYSKQLTCLFFENKSINDTNSIYFDDRITKKP